MAVAGIIAEYNPFHKGHKYQIDKIKSEMPDAKIVAIMSGNATQRAEMTIFEKHERAKVALLMGADLVLELPFPYSSSCAEIFALGGVQIAKGIGCDYLYFGTETAEIGDLNELTRILDTPEFEARMKFYLSDKKISYITAREKALLDLGFEGKLLSNDMLATEYVRAIKKTGAKIEARVIKRLGNGYNDTSDGEIMSASGIRHRYVESGEFPSVPAEAEKIYSDLAYEGKILDFSAYKQLLYRHTLLTNESELECAFDSSREIASFIKDTALNTKNADEFIENLSSKSFTRSRIMRVLLYSILGVNNVRKELSFTRLLSSNGAGREILKSAKKSGLTVITKHADSRTLTDEEKEILELDYKLDALYLSLLKNGECPSNAYKKTPAIK